MAFYGGGTVQGALRLQGRTSPGLSAAGEGRIYFDSGTNKFLVSENGGAYVALSGATETLADTLAAGNVTGGSDIVVSNGDAIVGETEINLQAGTNGVNGSDIDLLAGNATSGFGGSITLTSGGGGTTGHGGDVELTTGVGGSTSGNSGAISLQVGSVTSGALGSINIGTANDAWIYIGDTSNANQQVRVQAGDVVLVDSDNAVNIGTADADSVTIGRLTMGSLSISAVNVSIQSGGAETINMGTDPGQTVNVGSDTGFVNIKNLNAPGLSAPGTANLGFDPAFPLAGLVKVRNGYTRVSGLGVTEFGPLYYDPRNGQYVSFGNNSIYIDGDNNVIRSTDGDDTNSVTLYEVSDDGETYDLSDFGAVGPDALEPGTVTLRIIAADDATQFLEVTDNGAGAFPAGDVLPAGGTVDYANRTLTGVTAELLGGSQVEVVFEIANGPGALFLLRAGDASGTASGGDLTLRSGAGGTTSGNSGALSIDAGAVTSGTAGAISVGTTNASAVTVGRSGATTTVAGVADMTGAVCLGAVTSVSGNTTLDATNAIVLVDASGGPVTITLPAAAGSTRRHYTIKKIDSSANAVTIDGDGAETIDGATTQSLAVQYDSLAVVSDGSAWFIV